MLVRFNEVVNILSCQKSQIFQKKMFFPNKYFLFAWKFCKIFRGVLSEFSMFYQKFCLHASMQHVKVMFLRLGIISAFSITVETLKNCDSILKYSEIASKINFSIFLAKAPKLPQQKLFLKEHRYARHILWEIWKSLVKQKIFRALLLRREFEFSPKLYQWFAIVTSKVWRFDFFIYWSYFELFENCYLNFNEGVLHFSFGPFLTHLIPAPRDIIFWQNRRRIFEFLQNYFVAGRTSLLLIVCYCSR